jgi:hypothetical protein
VTRLGSRATLIALLGVLPLLSYGCAFFHRDVQLPPVSVQTVEYYPHQVKGYQSSYPPRRILILPIVEAREFSEGSAANHAPDAQGDPQIGVVTDRNAIVQRIYGPPLGPIVQKALAASAGEAGLIPTISNESVDVALKDSRVQYALAAKLVRCWVKKQRGSDTRLGPTWQTSAEFAVEAVVYKPPFHTPFWQGTSTANYDDPPIGNFAAGIEDDTSIYEEPGQVLSVALTRAIAGVFRRSDLHSLVIEDIVLRH